MSSRSSTVPAGVRRCSQLIPVLVSAALIGCADAATDPRVEEQADATTLAARNDSAITSSGDLVRTSRDSAGSRPGGAYDAEFGFNFPASLALTESQKAQIRSLRTAFSQSTASDSLAMQAILEEARAARLARKSPEEIERIMAAARQYAARIDAARVKLSAAIEAALTAAQRDWLARCRTPIVHTAEQTKRIIALRDAYAAANAADIAAINAALREIDALRGGRGGRDAATEQKVQAILQRIAPARARLHEATQQLARDVRAVVGPIDCR